MAKINKSENKEGSKIKSVYDSMSGKPNKEIALKLVELFPKSSKTKISEIMDVSRQSIHNYLK
jgi:hypothetical protein